MDELPVPKCICAKTSDLFKCQNCQARFYCSPECQQLDEPYHKPKCGGRVPFPNQLVVLLGHSHGDYKPYQVIAALSKIPDVLITAEFSSKWTYQQIHGAIYNSFQDKPEEKAFLQSYLACFFFPARHNIIGMDHPIIEENLPGLPRAADRNSQEIVTLQAEIQQNKDREEHMKFRIENLLFSTPLLVVFIGTDHLKSLFDYFQPIVSVVAFLVTDTLSEFTEEQDDEEDQPILCHGSENYPPCIVVGQKCPILDEITLEELKECFDTMNCGYYNK